MSKFKNLEKIDKMIFGEEENPEGINEIISKEQKEYNDFIKDLDEEFCNDISNFPLRYPTRITYPEYIKTGDDFILLSVKDNFYLFPKVLKQKLSDYMSLKKYFVEEESYKNSPMSYIIFCIAILLMSFYLWSSSGNLLVSIILSLVFVSFIAFIIVDFKNDSAVAAIKEPEFTELSSKLRKIQFPLEFFENNFRYIDIIESLL